MADEETPFATAEEHLEAEAKVLHPKLASREISFGPIKVDIRPLPLAVEREIMSLIGRAKKGEAVGDIEDYYEKVLKAIVVLAKFYGREKPAEDPLRAVNEAWVADHIAMDEAIEILNQQTEVGNASRFLRSSVRALFEPMLALCKGVDEADLTAIREYGKKLWKELGE